MTVTDNGAGINPVAATAQGRDPRLSGPPRTPAEAVRAVRRRVRAGELGPWPVIFGLIVIAVVFQSLTDSFLSPGNLTNLAMQIAAGGTIAVGIVFVLLLGEIDLSAGSVSGAAGALMAVLTVSHGWPAWLGILAALVMGALIGAFQGTIFAKIGVPSFVVTLGGLMGWLGLQLLILGPQGTINIPYDGFVAKLTNTFLPRVAGWVVTVGIVVVYFVFALLDLRRRSAAGLPGRGMVSLLIRTIGLGLLAGSVTAVLNQGRGVPLALVILVTIVVVFDLILRRTRYGRSIFAVGGNIEAARRAGLPVDRIRISVFALCSTLAAFGGILFASRGYSVGQSSGGSDTLLLAIAAAVIGGTSLFGGRGSTYSALLGILVLQSIQSGMLLVQIDTPIRYMVTAAVLVGAVILDSLSRRGRRSSGRE
ncbi:ABC transporter permease [Luedemannella flava]|uniref:Xylose transport system permease protein XylH n=1 Tax=Luedemannella flava TaxID=349316 RepID=A0ABN2MJS3_9ACTN